MPDGYGTDVVLWSEHQARLLRRFAAGEAANETPDWPNIAEEIESVGNEQLHAVTSLLVQALVHLLKAEAWPACGEVPQWLAEARRFRDDAADRYTPSMRERIDIAHIHRRALRAMPETINGLLPGPIRTDMPALEILLQEDDRITS